MNTLSVQLHFFLYKTWPFKFFFTTIQHRFSKTFLVPCLPGKYKNSYGAGVCKKCPLDHYQNRAAGNSCIPCGPNYGTDAEGSRLFTACYRKIRSQYAISTYCNIRFSKHFFCVNSRFRCHLAQEECLLTPNARAYLGRVYYARVLTIRWTAEVAWSSWRRWSKKSMTN